MSQFSILGQDSKVVDYSPANDSPAPSPSLNLKRERVSSRILLNELIYQKGVELRNLRSLNSALPLILPEEADIALCKIIDSRK